MDISFRETRNTISPSLARAAAAVQGRPLMVAIGMGMVNLTKRAFNEPGLRPMPWSNKADGTPATLRLNNVLSRSPRVVSATDKVATVGTDRKYAAIHQLGGKTRPMPARPFFPFIGDRGAPTPRAIEETERVIRARLESARRGR